MAARQRSRRRALQILFEWDMRGGDVEQAIAHYSQIEPDDGEPNTEPDPYAEHLVRGAAAHREEIDRVIEGKSEKWKIERMPVVDRNILRLSIFEMIRDGVPPPVAIDEAVQLAKRFSSDESLAFINGLLDAVGRETSASAPSVKGETA